MRGSSICCAMAALFLAGQAMAQDQLSYNKVDVGLVGASFAGASGEDPAGGGIDINGSWEFASHVFGFGELSAIGYEYPDDEDSRSSFAIGNFELGVGFNATLAPSLDLVAGLSWRSLAEAYDLDDDDDEQTYTARGVGVALGLRGLIGRRFAWEAGLKYAKLDNDDDDIEFAVTSLKSGFRYQFTRLIGVGVDVGINGYDSDLRIAADEITVAAMFRLQFDDRDGSPQWR